MVCPPCRLETVNSCLGEGKDYVLCKMEFCERRQQTAELNAGANNLVTYKMLTGGQYQDSQN
jgi:hypothetical protein